MYRVSRSKLIAARALSGTVLRDGKSTRFAANDCEASWKLAKRRRRPSTKRACVTYGRHVELSDKECVAYTSHDADFQSLGCNLQQPQRRIDYGLCATSLLHALLRRGFALAAYLTSLGVINRLESPTPASSLHVIMPTSL